MTSSEKNKDRRLRDTYNTTLEAQNEQKAKQGNGCAICKRSFTRFTAFQDHEHKCCPRKKKKFCGLCNRGLLCYPCNKFVVGVLERQSVDGVKLRPLEVLKAMIAYFEYWNPILEAKGCYETKEEAPVRRKKKSVRRSNGGISKD